MFLIVTNTSSLFIKTAEEQKNKVSGEGEIDHVVTSEKFGNMLKWFGPLMIPSAAAGPTGHLSSLDENDNNVLHKMRALLIEPYVCVCERHRERKISR